MRQSFTTLVLVGSVALILGGCEQEPWDPFGQNEVPLLLSDDGDTLRASDRECTSRYFYNAPGGTTVQLGCESVIEQSARSDNFSG